MSTKQCPYSGERLLPWDYPQDMAKWVCGDAGWLCDMCKRDAADSRTRQLVKGLALAGVLANPDASDLTLSDIAVSAIDVAAALRERAGGKEDGDGSQS